jgi:hypothetical protein
MPVMESVEENCCKMDDGDVLEHRLHNRGARGSSSRKVALYIEMPNCKNWE